MLSLDKLTVRHEPFPMGFATDVFETETYDELARNFPPIMLASRLGSDKYGLKFSIAEEFETKRYHGFLSVCPPWKRFYDYTQSEDFFTTVFSAMDREGVELPKGEYRSRFEFSFLPAYGGTVTPHRDAYPKIIAFVIPFTPEWQPEWGGKTEMLQTNREANDYELAFDHCSSVMDCEFQPNSANFLKRTKNSWHAVRCHGPAGVFRKSITLNLVGEGYAH